jgi:hypothetical protein
MGSRSNFRDRSFWIIITILLITANLTTATYLGRLDLSYKVFQEELTHVLSIIGTVFIAVYTPIYYILKRRYMNLMKPLLSVHMFGNITSFSFISLHIARRVLSFPLGIGIATYTLLFLLWFSGFAFRFRLLRPLGVIIKNVPHYNRSFHVSLTVSFYIVLLFHLVNAILILGVS